MAESSLGVKITADVTDLNAKLALAQANFRQFSSQTRKVANDMVAAGQSGSAQMVPALEKSAAAAAAAKAQIAALSASLEGAGGAASSFKERISLAGKGLDSLRLRIADYTSLASKFGELLVAGFAGERILESINKTAELGAQIKKLSEATGVSIETLSDWHYAAGQVEVATDTVDTGVVRLAKSIQQALMSPTSAAAQSFNQLGISQQWLAANSNDLQAVMLKVADAIHASRGGGQALSAVLNVMGRSASDMVPFLRLGSQGLADMGDQARKLGDEFGAKQADDMEAYLASVKRLGAAWDGFKIEITGAVAPGLTDLMNKIVSVSQAIHQLLNIRIPEDSFLGKVISLGSHLGMVGMLASQALVPGKTMSEANAIGAGGVLGPDFANQMAPAAQQGGIGNLKDNTAYDQVRVQFEKEQAQFADSRDAMLRDAVAFWGRERDNAALDATQKLEVESQYESAVKALRANAANESRAIARQDADTDLAISRSTIAAKKNDLQAELQAKQITAQQWLAAMQKYVQQEYQLDLQHLQNELTTLKDQPVEYDRVFNQIRELKAKLVQDMAQLDKQAAANSDREAKQQAKDWSAALRVVTGAEDSFVRSVFSSRNSLTVDLENLASQLVEREIADDLKYYTAKLAINAGILQSSKVTEQGGLLVHLLGETQKTAATVAGTARRTAVDTTANSGFLTRVAQRVAQWLGFETTSTAATVAGTTQRTAADVAGTGVAKASEIMRGMAVIQVSAAEAAAAAFADSAELGPQGLAAAPGVAAAAYGTVMGFGTGLGVASAAGGMWEVPGTILSVLHPNESVWPAGPAQAARSFFENGAQGGGDTYNFTVQAIDTQTGAQFLKNNIPAIVAGLQQQKRLGNSAFNPTAP